MLIDWFTVCAQAINFLVLVWLLKRFLYKPILLAIDTREKSIADQMAQAASAKSDAEKQRDDFQSKSAEFDKQRADLLAKATVEAKKAHDDLLTRARNDVDALRSQQDASLSEERKQVAAELAKRTRVEVFAIARKALTDLASLSLDEQMVAAFVDRLGKLSDGDKRHFADSLKTSNDSVVVRSAFDLPVASQTKVATAIKGVVGEGSKLTFATSPDLVNGIELTAQGYKVSWSVGDYLDNLNVGPTATEKAENAT